MKEKCSTAKTKKTGFDEDVETFHKNGKKKRIQKTGNLR